MNKDNISIKYFKHADVDLVKAFYQKTTYQSAASTAPDDEIIAAFNAEDIIGLYRLCTESEVCVLRGFFVLPQFQNKGIGTLMLMQLNDVLQKRICYLICKKQTNTFYAKAGFVIGTNNISNFLLQRKNKYNNPEMNILTRPAT
jgi:GNAT superfamily N-acetyltransferase